MGQRHLRIVFITLIVTATAACQTSAPIPTPMPVASVSPRPEASLGPSASPVAIGESWQALDLPTSDVGDGWIGLMEAVAATESGSVAVGRPVCTPGAEGAEPSDCHASVWTATLAGGWTRAPDQSGLEVGYMVSTSGPEPGMFDVAAGPSGIVAIGFANDRTFDGLGVAIWRSSDTRTWQRAQVEPALFSARVAAVAAGPQGYVIVGYVIGAGPRARAAAWTSPDGVTWTRAADSADMAVGPCLDTGEEPDCGGMRAVVATGSGFVAVGDARTGTAGKAIQPAAWTSGDGLTWERADVGGDERKGSLSGVTTGGPGLVAVGNIEDRGLAATSVDGSFWSVKPTGAPALQDIASVGERVFALGVLNQGVEPRAELQLWRTDDGVAWQRVTGLPSIPDALSYRSVDVAAASDRAVVVGWVEAVEATGADVSRNFSYASPPSAS